MPVKRTRLCYWIARPAKPGVQSSNTSRVRFTGISHTPMRSRLYHTHIMYQRNWNGSCLVDLIRFQLRIFQICNLLNCVDESWWNMPFKEQWRGDGVADDAVAMLLPLWPHYDVTQFEYVLWSHTMHEWVMNIHYQTWIAQGRFTNMILTPSKQWGVCDKQETHTRHTSIWSTLTQVTTCCLMTPGHYLNGYSFTISMVQWHSSEGIFTKFNKIILNFTYLTFHSNFLEATSQW